MTNSIEHGERERWAHSFVTARALSTILCMINQKKNSKFQTKEVFSLVGMNQSEKKKRNRKAAIFSSVSGLKSDKWISGTSAILAVHKKKVGQRYFIPERRDREWQRVTRGYLMLDDSLMCHLLDFGDMTRKSVVADPICPFFLTIAFNNVVTFEY